MIKVGDRVAARGWSHDWTVRAIYRGIAALTDDRGDDGFNTAWIPLSNLTPTKPTPDADPPTSWLAPWEANEVVDRWLIPEDWEKLRDALLAKAGIKEHP
jgi:hypothetical protein